ncbi:MAG: hypothetical protein DHS20C21_02560 [Gemmatimonadota bacterium]|nr:MAG: hypothetical protein DHS20C21_02560 [Gemmatimonadota bacterium]
MATIHDDPNTPPTAYVSAVFAVVLVAAIVALQAYFDRVVSEVETEKVVQQSSEELIQHETAQRQLLNRYEWTDQGAGLVTIPVERAMELVATELANGGGLVTNP